MESTVKYPPVYCLSGLGINHKVFSRLHLPLKEIRHIAWKDPLPGESLPAYAARLSREIPAGEVPVLIGLSFGGMVAIEMARHRPVQYVVLISSIKHRDEKPWWFWLFRYLPLYRCVSLEVLGATLRYWGIFFGLHSAREREGFRRMFAGSSTRFVHWALGQVFAWQNTWVPPNLLHLHGSRDLIFPAFMLRQATLIPGGDHGMVIHQAPEISRRIHQILDHLAGEPRVPVSPQNADN